MNKVLTLAGATLLASLIMAPHQLYANAAEGEPSVNLSVEKSVSHWQSLGFEGEGTESAPFLISGVDQFELFRDTVNGEVSTESVYFKLTTNLNLAQESWTPIGNTWDAYFSGHFDGDGHQISGLKVEAGHEYSGLFGLLRSNGEMSIKNISLKDVSVEGTDKAGGMFAYSMSPYLTLDKINVSGTVSGQSAGLIAGDVGTCYNSFSQLATMGRVVGTPSGDYGLTSVGGFFGNSGTGYTIRNSYSTATIELAADIPSGRAYIGGLTGNGANTSFEHVYFAGELIIPDNAMLTSNAWANGGPIYGYNQGSVYKAYYDASKLTPVNSAQDAVGLTTEEMTGDNALEYFDGFDFAETWVLTDGYPQFVWASDEESEGEETPTPDNAGNTTINGNIEGTVISFTVPTELSFLVNPNAVEGERFVAPEFTVSNDSNSPLTLSVGTFEETTDLFTDVHGDRYQDSEWDKLGVKDSKQFALALNLEEGENWLVQTQLESLYAKSVQDVESDVELGTIRPNSDVNFNFSAKHGLAFKEALNPEYSITFIFDLFNE